MESSTQFPQGLFEHFAINYLPVYALGNLARCSRLLNDRVKNLSVPFWNESIKRDFKNFYPHITVQWLKKVKNPQLARVCYIAFDFLKLYEIEPKYVDDLPINFDPLPSPVLCSWFNTCLDAKAGEMYKVVIRTIWSAVPIEDRKNFYEGASESIFRKLNRFNKPSLFLELDGFRDYFIKDTNLHKIKDETLKHYSMKNDHEALKSMFAITKDVVHLNQKLLNECLVDACSSIKVNIETIQTLIAAGAKPSEIPNILHLIIKNQNVEDINDLILFLLDHGADPNSLNDYQETPLMSFAKTCRPLKQEYMRRLLKANEDPKILHCLCLRRLEYHTTLQELDFYIPGIKMNGETALHLANRFDFFSIGVLRALLEAGEDPNALNDKNQTPLATQISLCRKEKEIISLLTLFKEFQVDFNQEPEIFKLIYKSKISAEALRFLFKNGLSMAHVDKNGMRCFDYVLNDFLRKRGREEVLSILLEEGLNLSDISDPFLRFYLACFLGKLEFIRAWTDVFPVAHGKDKSQFKSTPLLAAIQNGHIEIVEYLFEKLVDNSFDFNCKNSKTPLSIAVQLKDPVIRRKMVLLVVNVYTKMSFKDYKGLHFLIEINDTKLLTDVLQSINGKLKNRYLTENENLLVVQALKAEAKGFNQALDDVVKLYPNKGWEEHAPLIACLSYEQAFTMLPILYNRYPSWLFHEKTTDLYSLTSLKIDFTLFSEICYKLTNTVSDTNHIMELFRLVKGWIESQPIEKRKTLYGNALINLFYSSGNTSHFFKRSKEERKEVYDTLFTKSQMETIDKRGNHVLHYIFTTFVREIPPLEIWEEVKERLEQLQPDFSYIDEEGKTPLCTINFNNIFSGNKIINFPQCVALYKDMIRFAYKWKGGVFDKLKATPLHYAATALVYYEKTGIDLSMKISVELIKEYIACGHPIDIQDSEGRTPLQRAIDQRNFLGAVCLLERNAKVNIPNKHGMAAIDHAKKTNNLHLIARLGRYSNLLKK